MKTLCKVVPVLILMAVFSTPRSQAQDFEAIGKGIVTQLVARKFDQVEALFDPQMKAALPVSKLPEVWDAILAQVGPLKNITATRVTEKQEIGRASCRERV